MAKNPFKPTRTAIPGVYFIIGTAATGKPERIYYVSYYRDGKRHFEKAGRQFKDAMTPTKAAAIRADRIRGKELPNKERREAERALEEAQAGRWTFERLWAEWKKSNAQKRGLMRDDHRYRMHLKDPFGDKEPKEVSPFEVDRLRAKLLKTHAVGTVVSVLSLLRRIANYGVKRQLCEGLSFKVEIPKGAKQKTEDMTEAQMAAYIKVCREWPDPQEGNFQLLALYTGMRRGEVRELTWDDVDFDRGFIHIRNPKGGEDQVVPLSDAARKLLKGHPREGRNPYVFAGERKGPRGIKQIAESSRKIRAAAGLPEDFRPMHGLRHTFASHLASSGEVDLYTLQRLMTHKSPIMTQRYAHLRDDALKRGANIMSRLVADAEKHAKKAGGDRR